MILHILMVTFFVVSSLLLIVSNLFASENPDNQSLKAIYAISGSLQGITNAVAMLIILFLSYRFTTIHEPTI
jgi:hypothetical protein